MLPIISVVLSGGAGTRLWPVSREAHPKPFIKLADGQTLIEKTYARIRDLGTNLLTVTNRECYFMSRDEMERAGVSGDFILEPFSRNTAPAIAFAAHKVASTYGGEAIMLVLAADHLIEDQAAFSSAVDAASKLAASNYLVAIGISPSSPEIGFGYIECGAEIESGNEVVRFIEKPDLESAINYISSGKHLWNSGIFCFRANVFLEELQKCSPDVAKSVDICWNALPPLSDLHIVEIPEEQFKLTSDISIDYAVMEKSERVAVVPGHFCWNDVGSWRAVRDQVDPDLNGNRSMGESLFVDSNNIFTQSEGRIVVALGVSDLMIVDTTDALLVMSSEKSQDVKKVVAQLKRDNHSTFRLHRTVTRPWGTYTVLEESPGFKIKRIEVRPGASLSLQMHNHRSEHWVVVSGKAKITNGEKEILVEANESTYIPAGQKHRLENPGDITCVMIEVQCGKYLGEDDIIRYKDNYGRKN